MAYTGVTSRESTGVTPLLHLRRRCRRRHHRRHRRRHSSWHVGLHVSGRRAEGSGGESGSGGEIGVGNSSELATRLGPGTCWPSGWLDYSGVALVSHRQLRGRLPEATLSDGRYHCVIGRLHPRRRENVGVSARRGGGRRQANRRRWFDVGSPVASPRPIDNTGLG